MAPDLRKRPYESLRFRVVGLGFRVSALGFEVSGFLVEGVPCEMDKPHRGNPTFGGCFLCLGSYDLQTFGVYGFRAFSVWRYQSRGLGLWEWILLPLEQCI